jgi:hypothetical protein
MQPPKANNHPLGENSPNLVTLHLPEQSVSGQSVIIPVYFLPHLNV